VRRDTRAPGVLGRMGTIGRLPKTGYAGSRPKQVVRGKPVCFGQDIGGGVQDLPEIRNWQWTRTPCSA
jgi:hypothetical protein